MELLAPDCGGRTPRVLCGADGCSRDEYGYVWRCFSESDDPHIDEGCWIRFIFGEPQDIGLVRIALSEGTESARTLAFFVDGRLYGKIETSAISIVYHLDLQEVSEFKIYADQDASISGMWSIIHEVSSGVSSTPCTLARKTVDPQPLHDISSGNALPRLTSTAFKCQSWARFVLTKV